MFFLWYKGKKTHGGATRHEKEQRKKADGDRSGPGDDPDLRFCVGFDGDGKGIRGSGGRKGNSVIASFLQVGTEAVVPGEPVKGDYLFDGSHFDTMIPVAVDVSRVREAFPGWKEDLLKDESVLSSLQGIPQAGGQKLTPESLKAVLDGIEKYFPDEVTVEYYQNGENPFPFHMAARAVRAVDFMARDRDEPTQESLETSYHPRKNML